MERTRLQLLWANLVMFLAVAGPGIITANVDNDTGGITTYSLAGAQFGFKLLWLLIPITLMLIVVQEISARLGVVTGKGFADLIRERFRVKVTAFVMVLLVFVNIGNILSEFAGIAAAAHLFGIAPFILVPLCALLIWFVVLKGNYSTLEKIFLVASLFYISYILSGIFVHPHWDQVAQSVLLPAFDFSSATLLMLVALIGTTIAPWMQFYLQASVVEKGTKAEDLKFVRWDVILGSITVSVVAAFIIITNASTIFAAGQGSAIQTAEDAARALAPLAGPLASVLFAVGLFMAGFFSAAILPLSTTYSVCEGFGWESGVNKKFKEAPQFYFLFTGLIVLGASIILFVPANLLITVMFLSQALNGLLLPLILIIMYMLINDKKIMGSHVNDWKLNVLALATIVISIGANILFIASLLHLI